ncbi:uncharacterized protein LOC135134703 [Zophobas morio]|uniref:uncharacterized protein LOC135134703 n=1 Tax=Zophobas morio TaxID=2755281 RepID=UPI003083011E
MQLILDKMQKIDDANEIKNVDLEQNNLDLVTRFPVCDEESLQVIEDFISENEENREKVTSFLSAVGGRNAPEFIRRALSRLISNKFAILYSWVGHKGKKPFSNLKIAGVLKAAVKKFTRNSWTEKDIELAASKWLAKARDRIKTNKEPKMN